MIFYGFFINKYNIHDPSDNKTLKSDLASVGQASQEAKAHSLTKPSLARLRNVLSESRYLQY